MTTTSEIEYPVTEETLHISGPKSDDKPVIQNLVDQWMHALWRGDEYRARALALVAQADRLRAAFRLAESNERDALRLMFVTRGAMAIMEDCERHQMARLREWIASNRGKVLGSAGIDALREIFEIEEGG